MKNAFVFLIVRKMVVDSIYTGYTISTQVQCTEFKDIVDKNYHSVILHISTKVRRVSIHNRIR